MTTMTTKQSVSHCLLALVLAALMTSPARAWNDTGHRLIAAIAWADMTPAARTRFSEILKQHPRYKADLLADMPADIDSADQDFYAFGIAATWPDMVRSFSNPMHAAYNHPNWHYIDLPYCLGGQAANFPPVDPETPPGPTNAVEAIAFNTAALKNPATAPKDQAVALCWILHLCGDIHQPLHGTELFSPQYPNGDQGGNAIMVQQRGAYANTQTNLHALWDGLPGQYKDYGTIRDVAAGLAANPHRSRAALKDSLAVKDPAAWAQESHDLAVRYTYLNGDIFAAGPTTAPADAAARSAVVLPPTYQSQAEAIAMSRIVLAGYRTADLLNLLADQK